MSFYGYDTTASLLTTTSTTNATTNDWYWAIPPSPTQIRPVCPPRPQGFNRYVNASDLLEEFIRFLGENRVHQDQVLELPVDFFVKWLIIRACEEDGEEPNVTLALPPPKAQPRCLGCRRFMPKRTVFPVHSGRCAEAYLRRVGAAA